MTIDQAIKDKVKSYISFRKSDYPVEAPAFDFAVDFASDRYRKSTDVLYYQVLALYILHTDEVSSVGSSPAGAVQSMSEGGLSVTLKNTGKANRSEDLQRTGWGIELQALLRSITPFTAMNCNME